MIDNPHDAFFKLVFSQAEHAAGELRSLLPHDISSRIAWDTLVLCPGSFIDEDLAQSHTDLLFSARLGARPSLLYFLFEHLSTAPPLVPFRLLRYEMRIWDDWLSKHPLAKKVPPIVPIVLHHSEAGWGSATRFEEILDIDEEALSSLGPFLPSFRVLLDDVSQATDEALRSRAMSALGRVALWCFRDVRKHGVLARDLRRFGDLLAEVWRAPNGLAAMKGILRYITTTTKKLDTSELKETLKRLLAPIEDDMETLADQLEEMFMEKGIERGIERGRREALLRMLRKRFGELAEADVARVEGAKIHTLDTWTDRVLTARTLDEVWAD